MSATAAATDAPEMVLVPYEDFFAAYRFVPRSRMYSNDCLKTRLRSLLASEDVAHADEAEAITDRQAREEARDGGEWRTIDSAPKDGRHCILSVPHGAFFYSVQGCYDELRKRWVHVLNTDEQPLAWMPNVLLPAEFKPAPPAIEPSPVEGDRR